MATRDMVVFALGPVQSYIESARRTQDLWLGSQLLSMLAAAGAGALHTRGATLLLPSAGIATALPTTNAVPNRLVATTNMGAGAAAARAANQAVQQAWQGLSTTVKTNFAAWCGTNVAWQAIWDRQAQGWLETYWIVTPFDDMTERFGEAYQRAHRLMDARKLVRRFPSAQGEPNAKSSLSGEREALRGDTNTDPRDFWDDIRVRNVGTVAQLREGEQLCAIDTIKRFAQEFGARVNGTPISTDRFPSTSSIASASFRFDVLSEVLKSPASPTMRAAVNAQVGSLGALVTPMQQMEPFAPLRGLAGQAGLEDFLKFDGDCLYAETFENRLHELIGRGKREDVTEDEHRRKKVTVEKLGQLIGAVAKAGIAKPATYYAVLMMDGDRMGQRLGQCDQAELPRLSDALTRFAQSRVKPIVETENNYLGQLIYAGGDDVLALTPVRHALPIANELRKAFSTAMREADAGEMTASVGIAIVHHTAPLSAGLRAARAALNVAKETMERNALAVSLLRRSGEPRLAAMKWTYATEGGPADPYAIINQLTGAIQAEHLSGKVAFDVDDVALVLAGGRASPQVIPVELRKQEVQRLFKRHTNPKIEPNAKVEVQNLAKEYTALAEYVGWPQASDWLLLARFLAQGGRE